MNTPQAYIIPNPEAVRSHYRLSDEDREKNKVARENARFVFIEFLKAAAAHYQKNWAFEWIKSNTGGLDLKVNGYNVRYKFAEKWIVVENGGLSSRYNQGFYKQSTQIYYDKSLTMKDHGKKVVDVIESMIARDIKLRNAAANRDNNVHLSAHAMKYLANKHGFKIRKDAETGEGYWPSSSESAISISFYHGKSACVFTMSTTPDNFGEITMSVKFSEYERTDLDLRGTYVLGGLAAKYAEMQKVVNVFEHEFHQIVKFWPEAVAHAKEHGE